MRTPDRTNHVHPTVKPRAAEPAPKGSGESEEVELRVEELEDRIAPKLASNHSHTLLAGRV